MTSGSENEHRQFWQTQARYVSRRVNLGWWFETMTAPLLGAAMIGSAALLLLRREFPETPFWMLIVGVTGLLFCVAIASYWRASKRFEKAEQALVRMEATMRLRNALSAASAGVAPWPGPVAKVDAGLRWQWNRLWVPMLGALSLLAAGLWIPVSATTAATYAAPEQPQAWSQLNTELDFLAQEEVADEPYIEEMRKKLDELQAQEEEQWFSHSSLEATDSLKESHRAETERVEKELGRAESAIEALGNNPNGNPAEQARLMEAFDQAVEGLRNGAMKPNPELLEQMQKLDLKNLDQLTPEQLKQLGENLKKHAKCMGKCNGEGKDQGLADGNGEGKKADDEVEGLGKGGISRGPGHDPNLLGEEKEAVQTGETSPLETRDLSKSAPGDLLELQENEHDVDQSASRLSAGGNTDSTGTGGDRVWKESLDPAEQRVLKKFFE